MQYFNYFFSKRTILFICSMMFMLASSFAQPNSISGTITDSTGEVLPGVTVLLRGTTLSSTSDANGRYLLNVGRGLSNADVIEFRYLGFKTTAVSYSGDNTINTRMVEDVQALKEVVVTALGIRREEKALGYSATVVKGEDLTQALSNNWTDALSGKVAGLNLIRSNGGPAGSNKIILRGENNLTGQNEALIVMDGVIINQGSGRVTGYGGSGYLSEETPVDFGSGLNDINPEDIENITVLKGPGAAALYGQRGANGAIIITTKAGKSRKKGIGVTINSNTMMESVSRWPSLQYEYGQGVDGTNYYSYNASEDGPSTRSTSSAWGPRFDGQEYYQYDPITHTKASVRTPWVPYINDSRRFFESGRTYTNSISLDGSTDRSSARFSFTNAKNSWIIPNTGYKRNSVALSVSQKVTEKLQIASKINYNNKSSDNLPSTGYNNQSIMYWYLFWEPNASVDWLKDYWMPGQQNIKQSYPFSSYPDNPYLIANEMLNKYNRNGITGNIQATYNFTENFSLMLRTSLDLAQDQRSQQRPFDTEKFKSGMFRTQNILSQEVNSDFLVRYNKKISNTVTVSASAGGSMVNNTYSRDENRADSLLYAGKYRLANAAGMVVALPYRSTYAINSFYGLITGSYKDFLFLDITGRNDWNSVLATPAGTENVSFFYPSVNLSFVLSDALKLPKAISFAKVRASYAGVGSGGTQPYQTAFQYNSLATFSSGLANPTELANPNLQPLYTTSYEVGTDVRMFSNRLGFDVALYQGNTRNQIFSSTIDASSGFREAIVNFGMVRNTGLEIAANGVPFKSSNGFNWTINTTFSANRNKVVELAPGLEQRILQNGPGSRGAIIAMPGGSMGDLYGRGYERSPDGQIIYNNNGYPVLTTSMIYIGNTNPKWKASVGNTFKYKQVSFNVLADAQFGAVGYSLSAAALSEQGKTTNTLPGRYNGIIGKGVIKNADGTFRPNDVIAQEAWTYYNTHYGRDNVEGTTYSTDFLKLREARLDYTFKPATIAKLGLQRASVGVYGRDLFTLTTWPLFDPEFGTLSGGDINKGFEYGQFPSTRSFGLNLILGL